MFLFIKPKKIAIFFIAYLLVFPIIINAQDITIAILANHGIKMAKKDWTPTLEYLSKNISGYKFKPYYFLPNKYTELVDKVKNEEISFAILPPSMYVDLEVSYEASASLILVKHFKDYDISKFGSVIIANESSNITKLSQITKKTNIAAVAPFGFAGWLVAYDIFNKNGVDFDKKRVDFVGTQENVVTAVASGKADIGIIRSGLLEKLKKHKCENVKPFNILHRKYHKNFPFVVSSELFYEWTFAKMANTDQDLSREVMRKLLLISKKSNITKNEGYSYYWSIPSSYQNVKKLMMRNNIKSFDSINFSILKRWLESYKWWIGLFLLTGSVILFVALIYTYLSRKKIKKLLFYDELTGFKNFTYLNKLLLGKKRYALLLLDINNFSYSNLTYVIKLQRRLFLLDDTFKLSKHKRFNGKTK